MWTAPGLTLHTIDRLRNGEKTAMSTTDDNNTFIDTLFAARNGTVDVQSSRMSVPVDGDLHKVCLRLSVCQLSCQSAAVFFDSEMDAIRWSRLTHYIDAVPLQLLLVAAPSHSRRYSFGCNYLEWLCCGGRNC